MFTLFTRRKAASIAAHAEAAVRDDSANARQQRVFDRTVMTPDIIVPAKVRSAGDAFGLKPSGL